SRALRSSASSATARASKAPKAPSTKRTSSWSGMTSSVRQPVKHAFTFTPAISLFVECANEAELDEAFKQLSAGGQALMPPGNYGFSTKFAWVNDRFGFRGNCSWQLNVR